MPPDRILILGGTRDARHLAGAMVTEGYNVITSLAGVTETPVLPAGEVRVGGFGGAAGLAAYLSDERIRLVIDATHPFAVRMSAQAFDACQTEGVPLLRLERPPWQADEGDKWINVGSAEAAAAALPAGARVLLTIGRKDLAHFFDRPDISGIARMIEEPPLHPPANWRVMRERPPFTLDSETALIADNAITHLVTKNAGGSATEAKIEAARAAGIPVVMIARPTKPEVPCFAAISNLTAVVKRLLCP